MRKFDIIIIGAGIGGLTAGIYLSKKGYKVLILEKHSQTGGYCSSFNRSGFTFDCGAHLIGSCSHADSFGKLLRELDIKFDFVRLNPTDRFFFGSLKDPVDMIEVSANYREFIAYLQDRFKSEKDSIDNFFEEIHKIGKPFLMLNMLRKYAHTTYQEFLEIFFHHSELRGILSAQCGFLGLPPKEASAISAIFMLKMFMIDGAFYPKGGAQELANAFTNRFRKNGGTLLLSNEAKKILTKNKSVKGVLLESQEIYESNYVISAIDCKKTFFNLLDTKISMLNKNITAKLNSFKIGNSGFALYLGLNDKINLRGKNGWYYPHYDINKCLRDFLYLHIPTNYDATVVERKGYQVAILYTPFNFDVEKVKNWHSKKEEIIDFYLRKLKDLFPGLSGNIVHMEAATPKTFEKYTANTDGSPYGWKQIPSQVYSNGFPQKVSTKGLYLAGHWTVPGAGIVSVAFSGVNAARYVIRDRNSTTKYSSGIGKA